MLNSFPIALLVGTTLGFLAGLGVGGGSLLILWLTLILGAEQSIARSINLLFFLPTAAIATLFRLKQGTLNLRKVFPGIIAGCISAAASSIFSERVTLDRLQDMFGILLLITGARELLYRPKN